MKSKIFFVIAMAAACLASCSKSAKDNAGEEVRTADFPLFEDPVYDGPTDPMVCYNPVRDSYLMYYTSRRSNDRSLDDIESVHGSAIGLAESKDGGASWNYIGTCDIDYHPDSTATYWAPEVICYKDTFHMYLTYVPGIFNDWDAARDIVHLTSKDGVSWKTESVLKLSANKVIDACVIQLKDGTWRLWYNNEPDHKSIYYADSPDLYNWTDKGKVDIETVGEGPNVFWWNNRYYMIVDEWKGLSVFTSDNAQDWTKLEKYLLPGDDGSGIRADHADVEVVDNHAYMIYFSHNQKDDSLSDEENKIWRRCTKVYVAELELDESGQVVCDAKKPCPINLRP